MGLNCKGLTLSIEPEQNALMQLGVSLNIAGCVQRQYKRGVEMPCPVINLLVKAMSGLRHYIVLQSE